MPRKTDKRARLVEAAKTLIHQQGFNLTTLADIAQEADVPLGNVYYYFKTKEAIGESVVEKKAAEVTEYLLTLDAIQEPQQRLLALLDISTEDLELIARFGCSVGALCQELGKRGGVLADQAAKVLYDILVWSERQFCEMGCDAEQAADYALHLGSLIQGIYLFTHTFKDPNLMHREIKMIRAWLLSITIKPPILRTATSISSPVQHFMSTTTANHTSTKTAAVAPSQPTTVVIKRTYEEAMSDE